MPDSIDQKMIIDDRIAKKIKAVSHVDNAEEIKLTFYCELSIFLLFEDIYMTTKV